MQLARKYDYLLLRSVCVSRNVCHAAVFWLFIFLYSSPSELCPEVTGCQNPVSNFALKCCHRFAGFVIWDVIFGFSFYRSEIQGYKDIYSPMTFKCTQEFVLVTFNSYSAL